MNSSLEDICKNFKDYIEKPRDNKEDELRRLRIKNRSAIAVQMSAYKEAIELVFEHAESSKHVDILSVVTESSSYTFGVNKNGDIVEASHAWSIDLPPTVIVSGNDNDEREPDEALDALCLNYGKFKQCLEEKLCQILTEALNNIVEMDDKRDDLVSKLKNLSF